MKTETEINQLAAEAMGLCVYVCSENGLIPYDHHHKQPYDFCNDLNAAQKLVKFATQKDALLMEVALDSLIDIYELCNVLTAPAKTITLAALVALDKMTLEEAKEILK